MRACYKFSMRLLQNNVRDTSRWKHTLSNVVPTRRIFERNAREFLDEQFLLDVRSVAVIRYTLGMYSKCIYHRVQYKRNI